MRKTIAAALIILAGLTPSLPVSADEALCEERAEVSSKPKEGPTEKSWAFVWGGANVYPGLAKSEEFIDTQINRPLGLLLWDWDRPTTFKNYERRGFLWEPYAGVLKGLNRHFMAFATTGAIGGTIANPGDYHLLFAPLKVKAQFKRVAAYATVGLDYYPWETPDLEALRDSRFSLKQSLRLSKPFVAVGLTYMKQVETGLVRISLPGIGQIFKQKERFDYDFGHLTTRLGIEIPLGLRNSVTVAAGYAFCYPNSEEFSGVTVSIFHVYRF